MTAPWPSWATGTRPRRWPLVLTLVVGLLAAFGVAVAADPVDRTLAVLADPTQSLMSVLVPYLGILIAGDLRRDARLAPTLAATVLLAAAVGLVGFAVCAAALAVVPSTAADPWRSAGILAVGGVLVQVLAQLLGTGLGLLLRRPVVAFLASIVLPLGLWFLLTGTAAQPWLAPYSSVRNLTSGDMSPVAWAQWVVVLLIWGVVPTAVGVRLRSVSAGT